jgi:cephalosporin hydroxylase
MSQIDAILNGQGINGFEAPGGTDKQTIHSYGAVYEKLLTALDKDVITFLEVGVQYGGSLLLWHELLPNAQLIAVDIADQVHESIKQRLSPDRYSFFVADAYTTDTQKLVQDKAKNGLDVIVDDGPHTLASQEAFLRLYFPMLNEGGVAVVEDVQDVSWFDTLAAALPDGAKFETIDLRGNKGRYDDLMFIATR